MSAYCFTWLFRLSFLVAVSSFVWSPSRYGVAAIILVFCIAQTLGSLVGTDVSSKHTAVRAPAEEAFVDRAKQRDLPCECDEDESTAWLSCCAGSRSPPEKQRKSAASLTRRAGRLKFDSIDEEDFDELFTTVEEDIDALLQGVCPSTVDKAEIKSKLEDLKGRLADLPPLGWLRPGDTRVLLRFLRARQEDVDRAAAMFRHTHAWRTEHRVSSYLTDVNLEAHRDLDPYWRTSGIIGHDRDNDLVLFERMGKVHVPSLTSLGLTGLYRHEAYHMERVMAIFERERRLRIKDRNGIGYSITVIEDLQGLGRSHLDMGGMNLYKQIVRMDEDHYPDLVKRILVVRAPWIFPLIWKIAQHFFDEGTRQKIQIVSAKDTVSELSKYMSLDEVPKMLGGNRCLEGDPECKAMVGPGGPIPKQVVDRYLATESQTW